MNIETEQRTASGLKLKQKCRSDMPVIDCDVHNEFTNYAQDLLPYVSREWKHYITEGLFRGVAMRPYTLWQGGYRDDVRSEDGSPAAVNLDQVKRQHLDQWGIEYAILTHGVTALSVCYYGQYEWASELAKATNDWALDNWLGDPRVRCSMVVAAQHPTAAAKEIDRVSEHPGIIQVILPTRSPGGVAWCDPKYDPIWKAAERHNLVVGFHVNSDAGNVLPPTTAGWPRSYLEASAAYVIAAQSELIGIICSGVFERFPQLKVAMIENGFGWFPSLMWRLDKHWRELRAELPWLRRKPSEYAEDHIRFTTQPMEEPESPQQLLQLIDMMGSDEYLMFSTDYPHWNFDSPARSLPGAISADLAEKILSGNARAFYGLPAARHDTRTSGAALDE
ncbi:MAG: amidohydrolase family protein [Deltaproteobacteria bacterium]|nr:amidohydrolase family protein [Deltaproteobacteria bacterium]MPZ93250.1 amidohydrolase family protein [Actinomycetota bacterium]